MNINKETYWQSLTCGACQSKGFLVFNNMHVNDKTGITTTILQCAACTSPAVVCTKYDYCPSCQKDTNHVLAGGGTQWVCGVCHGLNL